MSDSDRASAIEEDWDSVITGRGVLMSNLFLSYAGVGRGGWCFALVGAELSPRRDVVCSLIMPRPLLIFDLKLEPLGDAPL